MNIIVDTREPALYDKLVTQLPTDKPTDMRIEVRPLTLGDIVLEDPHSKIPWIIFERKSLADLVSSIKDGRYEEQSHRLIHTSGLPTHHIVYIIEGMYSQMRSDRDRTMCLSAMTSLFWFKGCSVFRTCSVHETAELVYSMASKMLREHVKGKTPAYKIEGRTLEKNLETKENEEPRLESDPPVVAGSQPSIQSYTEVVHKVKKDNVTPENIGEIILCTIPGISSTTAIEIMRPYTSFALFMEDIQSHPEKLKDIRLTTNGKTRKLGKNVVENIHRFLLG